MIISAPAVSDTVEQWTNFGLQMGQGHFLGSKQRSNQEPKEGGAGCNNRGERRSKKVNSGAGSRTACQKREMEANMAVDIS